jgi:hypothetical protein
VTARIYHAPSSSDEPPNLSRSTYRKLEKMKSQHWPTREEHLLVRAHHAPMYRQPRKTCLVTAEAEYDDEHPSEARDMHRMKGNHRYSLKKGLKTELGTLCRST